MKIGDLVLPNWYSSDYFKAAGAAVGMIIEVRTYHPGIITPRGEADVIYRVLLGEEMHLFYSDEFVAIK